ncbi:hypothetical protein ACFY7A_02405 [Streptomyces longwoodensis]|uniref:hypothetical protein n=1 Tax=Streptomyces longwoodensis TaxID=68231 RepID=UPI00367F0641
MDCATYQAAAPPAHRVQGRFMSFKLNSCVRESVGHEPDVQEELAAKHEVHERSKTPLCAGSDADFC